MSLALYGLGGLRFWTEDEIELRDMFTTRMSRVVKETLTKMNPAWSFHRVEGPILTPASRISPAYTSNDVFTTDDVRGGEQVKLRAETTVSSYAYARQLQAKYPVCVWQAGKSFRKELNDGASAAKLRFNEFWQLEFQCIYRIDTKADYRTAVMNAALPEIKRFCRTDQIRTVESDRLPAYSSSTMDIEVKHKDVWREVASCSIRTDYSVDTRVAEFAFGLDRIVTIGSEQ